jgi:hypothetical protein
MLLMWVHRPGPLLWWTLLSRTVSRTASPHFAPPASHNAEKPAVLLWWISLPATSWASPSPAESELPVVMKTVAEHLASG